MSLPICTQKFKLNDSYSIPAIGLGTWQGQQGTNEDQKLKASIIAALQAGYRHIDTARLYGVEHIVGAALRESGVPRSDVFLVTKFWSNRHHDPESSLRDSLRDLGVDYVDLLLMHWPMTLTSDGKPLGPHSSHTFTDTWRIMENMVGPTCRSIGVSNFTQKTLDVLLAYSRVVPAVNQVELHALNPNLKLVPYCLEKGIHVTSWSTMGGSGSGKNEVLSDEIFVELSRKYNVSVGVISLSWAVQRGISVIPKSSSIARLEQNLRLVTLTDEDIHIMNEAHKTIGKTRLANVSDELNIVDEKGITKILGWTNAEIGWEDEKGTWLL